MFFVSLKCNIVDSFKDFPRNLLRDTILLALLLSKRRIVQGSVTANMFFFLSFNRFMCRKYRDISLCLFILVVGLDFFLKSITLYVQYSLKIIR